MSVLSIAARRHGFIAAQRGAASMMAATTVASTNSNGGSLSWLFRQQFPQQRETPAIMTTKMTTRNSSSVSSSIDTIYKFSVSQQHLDTVRATLPAVAKSGTTFTQHFYTRMFREHPELRNIFNQTNQALGGQPKKLLKTVALAAQAALDTGELPGEAIEGICQKHAALHIQKEAYDVVGQHLLGTIEDLLTNDPAVLEAWGHLYGDIAQVFITREDEIAKQVSSVPGSWAGRRKFVLEHKEKLSSLITRFRFRPVDGQDTPAFEAGKFTTIWVPLTDGSSGEEEAGEEGIHGRYTEQPRHYTLNLPGARDHGDEPGKTLSISVKKEGLVSRILHGAKMGTEWELSAPHGCFVMSGVEELWLTAPDTPVVFLSAGVGITPVLAMLENIYVSRPATWLHAAQNGNVHAYRDRLREIAAVRGGELQRRVWYESPLESDGAPGGGDAVDVRPHLFNLARYHYAGRMDLASPEAPTDLMDNNILHLDNENTQYFMCGPTGFMDAQKQALMDLGVSEPRIHWEGF